MMFGQHKIIDNISDILENNLINNSEFSLLDGATPQSFAILPEPENKRVASDENQPPELSYEVYSFNLGAIHTVLRPQTDYGLQRVAEIQREGTAGGPQ